MFSAVEIFLSHRLITLLGVSVLHAHCVCERTEYDAEVEYFCPQMHLDTWNLFVLLS